MIDRNTYAEDLRAACAGAEASGFLKGKRVLVTGATGMIGSFLVDALADMNARLDARIEIYAAGRSAGGVARRFGELANGARFHYVPYDATKPAQFDFDADYIVHAACSAHPMAYATDPVGTMQANLFGTAQLLEYVRARPGRRLLFLSTGEIYGERAEPHDGFTEGGGGYVDSMNPRSCYPESKRAAETLCASYAAQYGADALVARLCHVYGPTLNPANTRADAQFLRSALNGEDIVMKSPGTQTRSYCYVADAAAALLTLLERGGRGQAYNVAPPMGTISIRGYAETLAELAGVRVRFDLPEALERQGYSKVQCSVLKSDRLAALGWRPVCDVREGLRRTLAVLREAEGR